MAPVDADSALGGDRDPLDDSDGFAVIVHRPMQADAVVPNHHVAGGPPPADAVLGAHELGFQGVEQSSGEFRIDPEDPVNVAPQVEGTVACGGMDPDQGDIPEAKALHDRQQLHVGNSPLSIYYVNGFRGDTRANLPPDVRAVLDDVVRRFAINGVIIATDPGVHVLYARWAIERDLGVLIDKPLSIHYSASTDPAQALAGLRDYEDLVNLYRQRRMKNPGLFVGLLTQRRYHAAFRFVRRMIGEITAATGCPVTSFQLSHSDGQWRMPSELVDLSYHSYDLGYGKCAHSGYHFFDLASWLVAGGVSAEKIPDSIEVFANFVRPRDILAQLNFSDYGGLFENFELMNRYSEPELEMRVASFGEVDAMINVRFQRQSRTLTTGSISLVHNGLSERAHLSPATDDLYRRNGRIRQESHIFTQGPFQMILVQSFRAAGEGEGALVGHEVGGRSHFDVSVFRNSRLRPAWRPYVMLTAPELEEVEGLSTTQDGARAEALNDFIAHIRGTTRDRFAADLVTHDAAVKLMSAAYLSAAQQWIGDQAVAALAISPPDPDVTDVSDGR